MPWELQVTEQQYRAVQEVGRRLGDCGGAPVRGYAGPHSEMTDRDLKLRPPTASFTIAFS